MNEQGLDVIYISKNNPQINVQFKFFDNSTDVAAYFFKSWSQDFVSSAEYIPVIDCTILEGPESVDAIPQRADQALLTTVETAPATWAVQSKKVRLVLDGILQWEWDVTFEIPIFAFRFDGTWTRTR